MHSHSRKWSKSRQKCLLGVPQRWCPPHTHSQNLFWVVWPLSQTQHRNVRSNNVHQQPHFFFLILFLKQNIKPKKYIKKNKNNINKTKAQSYSKETNINLKLSTGTVCSRHWHWDWGESHQFSYRLQTQNIFSWHSVGAASLCCTTE